jgi:hypothetical protein
MYEAQRLLFDFKHDQGCPTPLNLHTRQLY